MSTVLSTTSRFQGSIIGGSGAVAAAIGTAITLFPSAFYAGYGITLPNDPNLLSELRAPGTNLAALGGIMLVGAFKTRWFDLASLLAVVVFFAFAAGRLVSWVLDGTPNLSILSAFAIEAVIGILVLLARRPT